MDVWTERHLSQQDNRPGDHRSCYQRDKARILHSAAFRRLQAKTQIMSVGQNDFYRTRLTHSLEAAQIGTALVAQLRNKTTDVQLQQILPDDALMESLCLAHDLGHPPFGHGGETALNHKMLNYGGFEGNGQTFRIVGKLEPYTESGGMDLCRRTLLGLLKYPVLQPMSALPGQHKPTKAIYLEDRALLDWVLMPLKVDDRKEFQQVQVEQNSRKSRFKSLDASIMELADDIAYGVHDLEDAVVTGTVTADQWQQRLAETSLEATDRRFLELAGHHLFRPEHYIRKTAIGTLVNRLITSIEWSEPLPQAQEPLIRYNACLPEPEQRILQLLKGFIYQHVILHPELQQNEFRGQRIVQSLFDAFAAEPTRLLPANTQQRWRLLSEQGSGQRAVCDYIAGMTDEYASRMMQRLYGVML